MIKGFIEVHNRHNEGNLALVNVNRIRDVWGCEIYIGDDSSNCICCAETYEEIKQKIKEAVGDAECTKR